MSNVFFLKVLYSFIILVLIMLKNNYSVTLIRAVRQTSSRPCDRCRNHCSNFVVGRETGLNSEYSKAK